MEKPKEIKLCVKGPSSNIVVVTSPLDFIDGPYRWVIRTGLKESEIRTIKIATEFK